MAAIVVGELTADQSNVILMAVGPDWEIAAAARAMTTLTPLAKQTTPPGALRMPASWPAVVQLSATFGPYWRPGPRLTAWITDQVRRRTAGQGMTLAVPPPPGMVPRSYQIEAACMIREVGSLLIFDEPGCIYGDAKMAVNRNRNRNGFSIKLRDLVARFNGTGNFSGPQWDLTRPTFVQREVNGTLRLGRIVAAWSSGVKTTYTVTTVTGRTIRATDEHPFLTERGWVRLDHLKRGDLVHVRGKQRTTGRLVKPRYRLIAGLRAHPYARGANRTTSPYRVAYHRLVAESVRNGLDVDTLIERVRAYNVIGLEFLDPEEFAVHHIDHNPANNAVDNLEVLTHEEHHRLHADEGAGDHVLYKTSTDRVVSVERFGEEETFDNEDADDPHNFLADGFVVHNTGKSMEVVLGLVERALAGHPVFPAVIVAPTSVVDPWIDEFRAWAPHLRVRAWRGSPARRRALIGTADVYVCSYGTARRDADTTPAPPAPLIALRPATVVADECHMLKHQGTEQSKAVRRLAGHATTFIGLSGTPITHSPADLWPALVALEPGAWPSRERWVSRYCIENPADYSTTPLGLHPRAEPEFRTALLGRHRRVAKADVLAELPPKVYTVRTVDLPPAYRATYDGMEHDMLAQLPDGGELSVMDVLLQFTRLSQLASAAADVETTVEIVEDPATGLPIEKVHQHVTLKAPSWKVDALLEVLDERPGKPVVAFTPSRQLTMLAAEAATHTGRRVGLIVGGQTPKQRTAIRESFQRGELDLMCVTTGAGGVGLTLTASGTAVFLQRPWSLVEAMQAEDRLHRIGAEQHESIEVIDIVARNTIDTRVRAVLRERAGQLADLVQDPRIVADLLGGAEVRDLRKKRAAA